MKNADWKTIAGGFVPGIALGILLMWGFSMNSSAPAQQNVENTKSNGVLPADNQESAASSVSAGNQPAGRAVIVDNVSLEAEGWVAIRERKAGVLGNILGATRKPAGTHERVVIDLLRATEPDAEYAIVIYTDNGDKSFDSKTDTIVNAGASPLFDAFTATMPVSPNGR